jgi:exopolysaccharide production protein ExoZ
MLRGAAALLVAIAHLHAVEAKFGGAPLLGTWSLAGFAGVDLFFVISGFVMVWVTRGAQGKPGTLPGFWFSRAARIYPLWWLVLSAIFLVWLIRPQWVYASHHTNPDILASFLLLPASELPLHAVGWTLIHELWFYFVFGLILLLPKAAFRIGLMLWGLAVTSASLAIPDPENPWLKLIRHPLTIEFLLGALVGVAATRGFFWAPRAMFRLGLFWFFLALLSIQESPNQIFEAEWPRVMLFGAPAAIMVWGALGLERDGQHTPKWSVKLGNWSYALYLIHVPVFAAIGRLAAPMSREGPLDNLLLILFAMVSAIVAAGILHHWFERPVARVLRKVRTLIGTPESRTALEMRLKL